MNKFETGFGILFGGFVFCLVATFKVRRPAEMLPTMSGTFIDISINFYIRPLSGYNTLGQ